MSQPFHQEELDAAAKKGCGVPDCPHHHDGTIYFHSRCHMKAGVTISYTAGTGIVRVVCSKCGKVVAEVAVASRSISLSA